MPNLISSVYVSELLIVSEQFVNEMKSFVEKEFPYSLRESMLYDLIEGALFKYEAIQNSKYGELSELEENGLNRDFRYYSRLKNFPRNITFKKVINKNNEGVISPVCGKLITNFNYAKGYGILFVDGYRENKYK